MSKFRTVMENIDLEIEQLGFKKDEALRKVGWIHTSNTEGCLWLWSKEVNGRQYLVNQNCAISIQHWLEEFGPRNDK